MTLLPSSFALAAVWTIDAIFSLANPGDPHLRPDGGAYAYTWKGSIYTASTTGGSPTKVASGSRLQWFPGGKLLSYVEGGQVRLSDGRVLTKSPTPVTSYTIDARGEQVFYLAKEPGPPPDPIVSGARLSHSRLYRQPVAGGAAVAISKPDWHVVSFAISPDGARATCAVQLSPLNRDVFNIDLQEVNLASGEAKAIVTQPGRDAEPSYSPDGRLIAFHSQGGTWNYFAARHVALVPSGGGTIRYLTKDQPYDVFRGGTSFFWSADSKTISYTAGRGVTDVLLRQDLGTGSVTVLAERISGSASFSSDGQSAAYLKTSSTRPLEVVMLAKGAERQLTHVQDAVASLPKMRSRVLRWKSPDGLDVEGILWLPFAYKEGDRVPLLVELHGGPTGVALDSFPIPRTYPTQLFLQKGYAILVPNFRGSCNYGEEFRQKNALSQGVGDYADVMSGIDLLIAQGIADPDRLGVMGWSYGGYLTGAVITKTNRFKAASIGAPATDWITYYGQFDGAKEVLWTYFGGKPWEVPENYIRHSSRAGLKNVRTPSMLQVGTNDINHNAEIYQALTDINVPVEYVLYPREPHGFVEPAHQRDLMERNFRWFTTWVK